MKIENNEFENLIEFYEKYKDKFKILKNYIKWFYKKLIINFKHK
jgi:hypothetical protein